MSLANKRPYLLVVDDETDLLQLMQLTLGRQGYAVKTSANADNLLDMVFQDRPDILLLDVHMKGVDGGTICQLLKHNSSTSGIPIILFSANDNIQAIAKDCGADGCVSKPLNSSILTRELERVLHN